MFESRKRLKEQIAEQKRRIEELQTALQAVKDVASARADAYDDHLNVLQKEKKDLQTQLTALRNVSRSDNELIGKLKKRVATQQSIIDKQKSKKGANDELGHEDPYIEE